LSFFQLPNVKGQSLELASFTATEMHRESLNLIRLFLFLSGLFLMNVMTAGKIGQINLLGECRDTSIVSVFSDSLNTQVSYVESLSRWSACST